jgi:hypothetical protein
MGGGGQLDGSVVSNANTALYTTFAVFGFGAGTFLNYYGARLTMAIGGFGYCVYSPYSPYSPQSHLPAWGLPELPRRRFIEERRS